MRLLIDGDMIAYAVACAADGKKYKASDGHTERYKDDITKYCKEHELDVAQLETLYEPEPVEFALHSVKLMLQGGIFDAFPEGVSGYDIFLTGSGNLREQISTIKKYKGNRVDTHKPYHLHNCRNYLVEWGAKIVDGMEADDAIGIAHSSAEPGTTCICSLDKDYLQIPGWNFNWNTQAKHLVTELEGWKNFFKQMLIGDSTDNILGLYGVGKDSAMVKRLGVMSTPEEMSDLVIGEYKKRFGSYWGLFFAEHYELLWILREER